MLLESLLANNLDLYKNNKNMINILRVIILDLEIILTKDVVLSKVVCGNNM